MTFSNGPSNQYVGQLLLDSFDPYNITDPAALIADNLAYYTGLKLFWLGPTSPPNDPDRGKLLLQIAKVFQSSNRVKEVLDREIQGLVGKRPTFYFVDDNGDPLEGQDIADAQQYLQRWVNRQYQLGTGQLFQIKNAIWEATKNMLVTGVGYLRVWSPQKFRNDPDPIKRICLHSPYPGSVEILRDGDGIIDEIRYTYTQGDKQMTEVQAIDPETGLTVFGTEVDGSPIPDSVFSLDLGGRYSIYEMRTDPMVTRSMKRAQNGINFALTMQVRSVEQSSFREKLLLGAQPPGTWDEAGNFTPAQPGSVTFSPGQVNYIQGLPLYEDGVLKGYTTPNVSTFEPVDVKTFTDTAMTFVAVIYHEARQSHLLGSDLELSGVSREQARQDHEAALLEHADICSGAIAGAYGTAFMMLVQEQAERFHDLDLNVQLQLSASTLTGPELQQLLAFQQGGLISKQTAISVAQFSDDPAAELELIKNEQLTANVVNTVDQLHTAGILDQTAAVKILQNAEVLPDNIDILDTNEYLTEEPIISNGVVAP